MNNLHLAIQFLLQIAVILLACRLTGHVAKHLGQPQVVAEMVAGIILGPSLFGFFWPDAQSWLFAWDKTQSTRGTQSYLYPASQIGLALYMFVVGMEFRMDLFQQRLRSSVAVALAGILSPLALGIGLAWILFRYTELFPPGTPRIVGMLFLGAAMCITALPVLARIIDFKKLSNTTMGTIALGAGAINDAVAWCLLALVLATVDNNWIHALSNIGSGVLYVLFVLVLVRPLLARMRAWFVKDSSLTEAGLVLFLALLALGAWFTERIGLHAVFGAFLVGVATPRGIISRNLIERIQPITVALLLPLFFTYSGLNTKMGLLNTPFHWLICGGVLVAAVLGKGFACWLAARATGISNREGLGIGTLMNARGLMELIIINIGLQRGIISEGLFTMLVIMAVATTLMTSPLFDLLVGPTRHQPIREPGPDAFPVRKLEITG